MENEKFPIPETPFDKLRKEKAGEGWAFMGRGGLTQTKFSKEAKFEEVPFQTEEDIKAKYLKIAKQQDPSSDFEVELQLDEDTEKLRSLKQLGAEEEYKKILSNLRERDKIYYVWVRRVESNSTA